MTRIAILTVALISIVATTGCEKTATNVPDESAAQEWEPKSADWEPPEGEFEAAERTNEEERAPFLSAR